MSQLRGFEVKESEEFGRFVIAKRDFGIGELMLDEEPLLTAPYKNSSSKDVNKSTFYCVGCFKTLLSEGFQVCPKCRWPVCHQNCAKDSYHAKFECTLFEEKKISVSYAVYAHIYIIRGVLMFKDQNTTPWEQFASLNSAYSEKESMTKSMEITQTVKHFFRQRFQMNVNPRIIGHIIGACDVNAFQMCGEDEYGNWYSAQAVYHFGSMFSHSCAPNAAWVAHPSDYKDIKRWNLRIYARRNIHCGEPINISYLGDCFTLNTAGRKKYIKDLFHFDCKCSRCTDASEFYLYTEAIICPSCSDDTLTADNPSDKYSKWTCNYCGVCTDYSFVKACVKSFDPSFIWNSLSPTVQDFPLMTSDKKIGLNRNHRKIIRAAFYCIEYRSLQQFEELFQHSKECDEMFAKLMKTATKCLKVFRMFGSMANVVELEWWFARMIAAYYFKTVDFLSIPYDPYLRDEKLTIITAICAHLKISHDTMEWFPFGYQSLLLRQGLIDGYKFWSDELNALKDVCSADLNDSSDQLEAGGVEVKDKVSCRKSELPTEAAETEQAAVSQSLALLLCDVITSPGDSDFVLEKPHVSLLKELDFYFE